MRMTINEVKAIEVYIFDDSGPFFSVYPDKIYHFFVGDMVDVNMLNRKTIMGRIHAFDADHLTLDVSVEYKSKFIDIIYSNIVSITNNSYDRK